MHPLIVFCIVAILSSAVWSLVRAIGGRPGMLNGQVWMVLLIGAIFVVMAWNSSRRGQALGVAEFGIMGGVLVFFAVVLKILGLIAAAYHRKTKQTRNPIA